MKFNEENSRKVENIENIESYCKETHQTVICHTVDTHMSYTCCIAVAIVTDLLLDLTSRISAQKFEMGLSPDAKERLGVVFEVVKTAFHWGFIPTVLYLGKNLKIVH